MEKTFRKYFWPILIILVVLGATILNYQPETWLTGWDNLHPEFNFSLNIKRSLFAVWQEYQGLGLLGGMAHATDFPRQIFLWFSSLILPTSFLRYFHTFLMLLLGPLGIFFLIKKILRLEREKEVVAFLGALFYLLNLATIQTFFVPYEAFVVHYGLLPWLFYAVSLYLDNPSYRNLLILFVINLLALPQAYVPTVFLVYFLSLLIFLGVRFIQEGRKEFLFKAINIIILTLVINAFWLLPFTYFIIQNRHIPVEAKINQMATEEVFLKNQKYGQITDVILLKGFWLDNVDAAGGINKYLMQPWREWLDSGFVNLIGYLLFAIITLGFAVSLRRKGKKLTPFLVLGALFLILLTTSTPPFSWFNNLWRQSLPFLNQTFRFPFTKFSLIAALSWVVLFSQGISFIYSELKKDQRVLFALLIVFSIVIFSFPVFQGNLFYSKNRNEIPEEYFSLFEFFENEDKNSRIANFPQSNYWGWSFYNWQYSGSGFLWYGIQQPILDRAFDVWSREDENYYWQVSKAVYSSDKELLESILEKYQINWLVIDGNIITVGSSKSLYLDKLEQLLESSRKTTLVKRLGEIRVYQVNLETPVEDFVFLTRNLPGIKPAYKWNNEDTAFLENGHYISDYQDSKLTYYPFRSLFTGKLQEEIEFKVKDRGNYFSFIAQLPQEASGSYLVVNPQNENEFLFWDKDLVSSLVVPQIWLNEKMIWPYFEDFSENTNIGDLKGIVKMEPGTLEVRIAKNEGFYSYDSRKDSSFYIRETRSCNLFNIGLMKKRTVREKEKILLRFESLSSSNCLDINLPLFQQDIGYLVKVESRYLEGKSILFSVINKDSRRNEIETFLPKSRDLTTSYFIVPPMENYGQGYVMHFDNISIGNQRSINDLGRVEVYPIPYQFLKGLKVVSAAAGRDFYPFINKNNFKVEHPNPSYYKVTINPSTLLGSNEMVVLSQAYHPGWLAWEESSFIGKRLDNHLLVNNWANGWQLEPSNNQEKVVYLFYWPQLLQYFGFILLVGVGVWLIVKKKG